MADTVKTKDADGANVNILTDTVATVNGSPLAAEVQRVKLGSGADGVYTDFDPTTLATQTTLASVLSRLPAGGAATEATLATLAAVISGGAFKTRELGTYGYASGTAAGSIDVPTGALIKRVSVVAGDVANATITILGGATITVLAGSAFDERIPGDAVATSSTTEVVIGGTCRAYYVAWTV